MSWEERRQQDKVRCVGHEIPATGPWWDPGPGALSAPLPAKPRNFELRSLAPIQAFVQVQASAL